jgi:hypothetical protein
MERANLRFDAKGKVTSGSHREGESSGLHVHGLTREPIFSCSGTVKYVQRALADQLLTQFTAGEQRVDFAQPTFKKFAEQTSTRSEIWIRPTVEQRDRIAVVPKCTGSACLLCGSAWPPSWSCCHLVNEFKNGAWAATTSVRPPLPRTCSTSVALASSHRRGAAAAG